MKSSSKRTLALLALGLLFGMVGGPGSAPLASAETADPDMNIEGWYSRPKPRSPAVEVPGVGSVSPGPDVPPDPRGSDGNFVVASNGGPPGETDTAWSAFQWDTFAALGGTIDKFEVTFTQSPQARGDFGTGWTDLVKACNIVVAWGAAPTANPWQDRVTPDCSQAKAPTVEGSLFTWDFTAFAQSWLDGDGFGVVIVPGSANDPNAEVIPFQLTLAGDSNTDPAARPKVTFEFSAGSTDLGGPITSPGFDFDDNSSFGGGESLPAFEPTPDLDVFPNDVGSTPDPVPVDPGPAVSSPDVPQQTAAPQLAVSGDSSFPFLALLLTLLLGGIAFWGLGTALGPAGDPVPVREGGVSRLLSHRADAAEPSAL